MYAYLVARFGEPNGIQNFLRRDGSDNIFHWDFNLKAGEVDVYIAGASQETHILVTEALTDEQWKSLILAMKADYRRVGAKKSNILRNLEKYVLFQNKFVSLADLCAELHANITNAPDAEATVPKVGTEEDLERYKQALDRASNRAKELYGDCLKLRLLTPVMAEAFINMVILIFCKDEIRNNRERYQEFVRAKVPDRLTLLSTNCHGFVRPVDRKTDAYAAFMRVINKRNFALHGNVDPLREAIEIIYFDGKRPLFANPGNHIQCLLEQLERLYAPSEVVSDYEAVHGFLVEITDCLTVQHRQFFEQVITDAYPGYELKKRRVTRILPDHRATSMIEGIRYDDQLNVKW